MQVAETTIEMLIESPVAKGAIAAQLTDTEQEDRESAYAVEDKVIESVATETSSGVTGEVSAQSMENGHTLIVILTPTRNLQSPIFRPMRKTSFISAHWPFRSASSASFCSRLWSHRSSSKPRNHIYRLRNACYGQDFPSATHGRWCSSSLHCAPWPWRSERVRR